MILAISGGVDSVVLLDLLAKNSPLLSLYHTNAKKSILLAHFNHGIRGEESDADERFVRGLAVKYGLECVVGRGELGPSVSEVRARAARWSWLESLRQNGDEIATAHHLDDLVGSVVINLRRGTGWRGLAVLGRPGVARPLLQWTKQEIYDYAVEQRLEWVEDRTNRELRYLRNRLRGGVERLPSETKCKIRELALRQAKLGALLNREWVAWGPALGVLIPPTCLATSSVGEASASVTPRQPVANHKALDRALFDCDYLVADELLRAWLEGQGVRTTRPTRARLLKAIRTYENGKKFNLPGNRFIQFRKTAAADFSLVSGG
jgi:tRNA(Ile)-lysidine synthetase-like protein